MWRANYSQSLCYWRRFDFNNDLIYSCKSLLVLKQKSLLLKPSLPCVKIQHNYDVWGVAIINFQMHPFSLNQIQTIFSILRSHSSYSQHSISCINISLCCIWAFKSNQRSSSSSSLWPFRLQSWKAPWSWEVRYAFDTLTVKKRKEQPARRKCIV